MRYRRQPTDTPDHDAQELRPWRPEHGPPPTVTTYQWPQRPSLWIYMHGQWRSADVIARHNTPAYTAYQVAIRPGGPRTATVDPNSHVYRTYLWGTPAIRAQGIPE